MEDKVFDLGAFYLYHFNGGLEERKQNGWSSLFREGYSGLLERKFWEENWVFPALIKGRGEMGRNNQFTP